MVTEVAVKLTTPVPELLALNVPLKVAEKLLLPATGMVCVMVNVKVPEALITPLPETKVWKLPKLEPVGVFRLVEPIPLYVIISSSNALIIVALNRPAMSTPLCYAPDVRPHLPSTRDAISHGVIWHPSLG